MSNKFDWRRNLHIKQKAEDILHALNVNSLPVKIEEVAKRMGLTVMPFGFDEDISGILIIKEGQGHIGYNQNESRVRRRFNIAHECGHFALHKDQHSMFMDKGFHAI